MNQRTAQAAATEQILLASLSSKELLHERVYYTSNCTKSPRRTIPPCSTDAYTPAWTWLYFATVRKMPKSLGRSPCGRVIITHLVQGAMTLNTISSPTVSFLPTHEFSIKSFSIELDSITMFGLNLRTSKRPSG